MHGADEDALGRGTTAAWREALAAAVARTRAFFEQSRPLPDSLPGRLKWEVRATWLGGLRMLDTIERQGFGSLTVRPTLGLGDVVWIALRVLR